ncbi:MAG: hypothetical protein ACTSRP_20800 [Candidatus Helarchaeota archaeon]
MECLNSKSDFANEFIKLKRFFSELGFEIIGTKDVNNEIIYFIKRKKGRH